MRTIWRRIVSIFVTFLIKFSVLIYAQVDLRASDIRQTGFCCEFPVLDEWVERVKRLRGLLSFQATETGTNTVIPSIVIEYIVSKRFDTIE